MWGTNGPTLGQRTTPHGDTVVDTTRVEGTRVSRVTCRRTLRRSGTQRYDRDGLHGSRSLPVISGFILQDLGRVRDPSREDGTDVPSNTGQGGVVVSYDPITLRKGRAIGKRELFTNKTTC